jgi:hypothetical protein
MSEEEKLDDVVAIVRELIGPPPDWAAGSYDVRVIAGKPSEIWEAVKALDEEMMLIKPPER